MPPRPPLGELQAGAFGTNLFFVATPPLHLFIASYPSVLYSLLSKLLGTSDGHT